MVDKDRINTEVVSDGIEVDGEEGNLVLLTVEK